MLHGIKLVGKLESKRNNPTRFIFLKVHSQVNFKEILPPAGHGTFPLAHVTRTESLTHHHFTLQTRKQSTSAHHQLGDLGSVPSRTQNRS